MIDISENVISGSHKRDENEQNVNKPLLPRLKHNIMYEEFFTDFLMQNKPCIIESNFTSHWKSRNEWVQCETPNLELLKENFGSVNVPVADCNHQYYNAQKKCEEKLSSFLEYWEQYCLSGYSPDMPCLYMKDWHFTKDFPDYEAYEWPSLFASDWLNEYWATKSGDDYRFIYMGPKGSWTPLHCDVLTSYSWSTNICGRKRWLLFPPGNEKCIRSPLGDFPFDVNLSAEANQAIDVEQGAGETIFVPSGWHHQVWNIEDTISVNHNWINGCCLSRSWAGLLAGLDAVRKELDDCKDMEGWDQQCQVVLAATTGTDLQEFLRLLTCVAHTRIQCLEGVHTIASGHWLLGKGHALFDLQKILEVLPEVAKELGAQAESVDPLMSDIERTLSESNK